MSEIVTITVNGVETKMVPINRNLAGDFIGFTFDDKHSSDFNLIRVSNGSRYESNLLPSFQDATVQAEGKDGVYYFGSTFKERAIKVSTAFDQLTEDNYRKLNETFSDKKLHRFCFDENPYKIYYVKLKQNPTIKNLCFDEGTGRERIYRGEMELEFVCYPSFAVARAPHVNTKIPDNEFVIYYEKGDNDTFLFHNHYLVNSDFSLTSDRFYKYYGKDGATLADAYNYKEWAEASRLEVDRETSPTSETVESSEIPEGMTYQLYNPGDCSADIRLIYTPSSGQIESGNTYTFPSTNIILYKKDEEGKLIEMKRIGIKQFQFSDVRLMIDSKTHLIAGLNPDYEMTGKVYNNYHIVGDFFEVPKSAYSDNCYLKIEGGASENWQLGYTFYYV